MTRTGFQSRSRVPTGDLTAVCFLFDTAILWNSDSGSNTVLQVFAPPGFQKKA
jgi:hypothetical protein